MKNDRLSELLASARNGNETAISELFTSGGCHVFAFAKALHLNGTAELMTEIAIPNETHIFVEKRSHAWCNANSRLLDYFGDAKDEGAILARFADRLGWSPKFVPETKPHTVVRFPPSEIREVLSGTRKLPAGYYDDTEWLNEAVAFAAKMLL